MSATTQHPVLGAAADTPAPGAAGSGFGRRVLGRRLRLLSDEALAERFAAGEDAAFGVLHARHRAGVFAVCLAVLGSRHDAEDAAQEAFASLAAQLRAGAPRELRPWLTRVARNAAIDARRRRRETACAADEQATAAGSPVETRAELRSLLAGLAELPESQRTALLLRELAGHSYAEIGMLLEVDEQAVRGLIQRARIGLRAHRDAAERPCAEVRAALAAAPAARRREPMVRRHLRACASCREYASDLRRDARDLRSLVPSPDGGLAGPAGGGTVAGKAMLGGLAAKGAIGALTQIGSACAVSVCALGGVALLTLPTAPVRRHDSPAARHAAPHRSPAQAIPAAAAQRPQVGAPAPTARSATPVRARATSRVAAAATASMPRGRSTGAGSGGGAPTAADGRTPAGRDPWSGAPGGPSHDGAPHDRSGDGWSTSPSPRGAPGDQPAPRPAAYSERSASGYDPHQSGISGTSGTSGTPGTPDGSAGSFDTFSDGSDPRNGDVVTSRSVSP